jgi:hypothetical protein
MKRDLLREFINSSIEESVYYDNDPDVPHGLTFNELRRYLHNHFGKAKITLTSSHLDLESNYVQRKGELKPSGIWYGCGTTWLDFIDAQMSGPGKDDTQIWSLKIDMSKVKQLIDPLEIADFTRRYKDVNLYIKTLQKNPDWTSVASSFDGIECCPYPVGGWEFRYNYTWYYGIDMSSGCIWNTSAITHSQLVAELKEDGWEVYV